MLCLAVENLRGSRYYIKIVERMVFIAYMCIEPHPLALVLAGSQSEAGSAHTCNPSLSSLESQTRPNNFDIKRSGSGLQYYSLQCAPEIVEATRTRTRTRSLSIPCVCVCVCVCGRGGSSIFLTSSNFPDNVCVYVYVYVCVWEGGGSSIFLKSRKFPDKYVCVCV